MTWLNQDDLGCDPTEDSVVVDGQLYLRLQTTRPARVLVTYVETRDWTIDDLRRLRKERPDLEGYWPEPGAENGGVRWIPRRLRRQRLGGEARR